jgi:ribosomal protein L7/L12
MPQCPRCQHTVAPDAERCPDCGASLSQQDRLPEPSAELLAGAIRLLMKQGRKIEAVKLYREQRDVGLAVAKDAVERIERGESLPDEFEETIVPDDFDGQLLQLLSSNQKIAAIKLYRERTGSGLKEAKDAVEALGARHGIVAQSPQRGSCLGNLAFLFLAFLGVALAIFVLLGK